MCVFSLWPICCHKIEIIYRLFYCLVTLNLCFKRNQGLGFISLIVGFKVVDSNPKFHILLLCVSSLYILTKFFCADAIWYNSVSNLRIDICTIQNFQYIYIAARFIWYNIISIFFFLVKYYFLKIYQN